MNRQAHMSIFLRLAASIGSWVVLAAIDAFTFFISSYNSIHNKNFCQRLPTGHRHLSTVKEVHHCIDYEFVLAALHTSQQLIRRLVSSSFAGIVVVYEYLTSGHKLQIRL